ncbi:MAG: APC family permease [Candidatus Dormibacteraeota bacterium]|nr:APC family permease [Candidatus Dormibacteraeota bacterium]
MGGDRGASAPRPPRRQRAPFAGELVRRGKSGQGYVRVRREDLGVFRRQRGGYLVSTEAAEEPRTRLGQWLRETRNHLIGRPLPSEAIESERMSVFKALPILSSDALSSVAYGPEAALAVLAAAGAGAFFWNIPISIAVALLMLIVTISYQQVIRGYQGGGGSYAVARANLGVILGLVAGAALLVDYVLTVAVSVSAGVDALLSAYHQLLPYRVPLLLGVVALLLVGNLRGVREAGLLFAIPTYLFIVAILALIAVGLARAALGFVPHPGHYAPLPAREALTPLLVLAAFASGSSSMTGIEAVSNGVPAFKEPRTENATRTLAVLGGLLIILFIGVEALDVLYAAEPHPNSNPTVLSEIASAVFGGPLRWAYYAIQFSTTLVLVLAANTSFAGFPRLCAILARDDFLPHRFGQLGKRLVYSSAMVFLALTAAALMLAFDGRTDALINLFALGVFTAFSLAQTAMARQWWTRRGAGWRRGFLINALGAAVTALVDAIIIVTKSPRGAWVVVVLIPALVLLCWSIHRYYLRTRGDVERIGVSTAPVRLGAVVVPILRADQAAADALGYGRLLGKRLVVLQAAAKAPPEGMPAGAEVRRLGGRPLRSVLAELDSIRRESPGMVTTVVVPDQAQPFWMQLLLRPDLALLKLALLRRRNVVAASCPGFLSHRRQPEGRDPQHVVFVPVSGLDPVTVNALRYARALAAEVVAIHVVTDVEERARDELDDVPDRFDEWAAGLEGERPHVVVIQSPYRAVVPPVLTYILRWRAAHPDPLCTTVVPELVDERLLTLWLHNHRAFWLKAALLREPGVGVADVTLHIGGDE